MLRRMVTADWFESQFRPATGIDVYATSFPHQDGHLVD